MARHYAALARERRHPSLQCGAWITDVYVVRFQATLPCSIPPAVAFCTGEPPCRTAAGSRATGALAGYHDYLRALSVQHFAGSRVRRAFSHVCRCRYFLTARPPLLIGHSKRYGTDPGVERSSLRQTETPRAGGVWESSSSNRERPGSAAHHARHSRQFTPRPPRRADTPRSAGSGGLSRCVPAGRWCCPRTRGCPPGR